ncbi:hypothetical protein KI387_019121 [Taxus chinensis]|uniref:F-box domain-containing protein n=1 Tax=Taxus chinensis TaxID=29808 RepID=A0AA38G6N5_TAXCH|nr:hypothetical protein KI387_019121 [Taxus chinensis]
MTCKHSTMAFDILPEEIIHEILCRLPLDKVLQVQSVCRSWHATVSSSPIFHKLWEDRHSEKWLVMDQCDHGFALFNTKKWLKKKILSDPKSCWRLLAAAGGLLLYKNNIDGMLKVVNPLTLLSRQLSDPAVGEKPLSFYIMKGSDFLIDLYVDSRAATYKILIFGRFSTVYDRDFLIYRSGQLSWKIILSNGDTDRTIRAPWLLYKTTCNKRVYRLLLRNYEVYEDVNDHVVVSWGSVVWKGRNIMLANCWGVVGRVLQIIYELDEGSGRWIISSVCRRNSASEFQPNYIPFDELLCEKEFPLTYGGRDNECIWIMPTETEEDIEETQLELQQKHTFNGYNYQNSTAFPTPLRFWPIP